MFKSSESTLTLVNNFYKPVSFSVLLKKISSHFLIAVVFFICIAERVNAQHNFESTIKKGLELSYHFKWNEAEKIFSDLIKKHPDNPTPYHYYSGIYLWYYLSSHDEADLSSFTKHSDLAIAKASDILEDDPQNTELMYILGANYNYRAIAFARAENYLDAIWASKKSESYLREVLKREPENADACLGLGLYSFSVSQVPSAFSWALSLAGIKGSIEEGLNFIRQAAEHGDFSKVEAQYYLSQILSGVVFDFEESAKHLNRLSRKYPENIVFNYSLAVIDIKNKKLSAAEKILSAIVKSDQSKFKKVIAFSNFLLGDVNFKQNQFENAIKYYEIFLEQTPDKDYTGIASFRLAVSYELTGNRKSAEEYFLKCSSGNMDLEDDVYAKRRGAVFSKRTLSESEADLIRFANLVDDANYKSAFDSLSSLLERVKTDKLKSEIFYYMSEALFYKGMFNESAEYAEKSFSANYSDEKWIKAFAYYNSARAFHHLNEFDKRDGFLELAEDHNDYDYQTVLKNLVYVLRRESKSL